MGRGWHQEPQRHSLAARGVRTTMRANARPGRGKFEACDDEDVADKLYDQAMQSFQDDEVGSVQELGWYGFILNSGIPGAEIAIVNEDSNGFFTYQVFDNEADAYNRWEKIQEMYEEYYKDVEDEDW